MLEYIRRCYDKCSNEGESKHMEGVLRKLVHENESRLQSIKWHEREVPKIPKMDPPAATKSVSPMVPTPPLR